MDCACAALVASKPDRSEEHSILSGRRKRGWFCGWSRGPDQNILRRFKRGLHTGPGAWIHLQIQWRLNRGSREVYEEVVFGFCFDFEFVGRAAGRADHSESMDAVISGG